MTAKEVFDDMKIVLESWGTDEYTKKYNQDGYELVITIRRIGEEEFIEPEACDEPFDEIDREDTSTRYGSFMDSVDGGEL